MASIRADDPRPPYVQIADELRRSIAAGELRPGERLESGRALSDRYGVAAMTLQRAIQLLRAEGLLVSSQGRGVYVAEDPHANTTSDSGLAAKVAELEQAVRTLTERVDSLDPPSGVIDHK